MSETRGVLYGVGVGPGDPDLITIKAIKILREAEVIFAASSINNSHSLAVEIARPHLSGHQDIRVLQFQMSHNEAGREALWEQNSQVIIEEIEQGKKVAFLTLGDPMTYSTFGYLIRTIHGVKPAVSIVTIPGITSYQAAAARINTPLVEGDESLLITSGVRGGAQVRKFMEQAENIVLLKTYKNISDINEALLDGGLIGNCVGISKCGREGETIVADVRECKGWKPDYWTLYIAKKNRKINISRKEHSTE